MLRLASLTLVVVGALAAATTACSSKADAPPAPLDRAPVTPRDAGVDGITSVGTYDPHGGMHLDDDSITVAPGTQIGSTAPRVKGRPSHPIDVILRSTPSGARAAVDGTLIGVTPTYWAGDADGREHEFTFVLARHASARYRFVPVTSGVVHARLEPISDDAPKGAEPVLVPRLSPEASIPLVFSGGSDSKSPAPLATPPTGLIPDAALDATVPIAPPADGAEPVDARTLPF